MRQINEVIANGIQLNKSIMDFDKRKFEYTKEEVESRISSLYREFCGNSGLSPEIAIRFDDVHSLIGRNWHTELAYFVLNGSKTQIIFHDRLLSFKDEFSGLVFAAKAWVVLPLIEFARMISGEMEASFLFEIGDNGGMEAVAFCSNSEDACLIPDYQFITSFGYKEFRDRCAAEPLPWKQRENKVFWRGSTTGRRIRDAPTIGSTADFSWLQRLTLCDAAAKSRVSSKLDVGISDVVQIPEPHLVEMIRDSGLIRPRVDRSYFRTFRFNIDIDGNSNAWSGLFCALLGGSCVIKVDSAHRYRQWYYEQLVNGYNIYRVSADLDDLETVLEYALSNEVAAEQVAFRGKELANRLTVGPAMLQAASTLLSYIERNH